MPRTNVLILGYGSFGRAIHAAIATRPQLDISVYTRSNKEYVEPPVRVFAEPTSIPIDEYEVAVVALPSHALHEVLGAACLAAPEGTAFLSCVKGIHAPSGLLPSEVIYEATGSAYTAVLSGASFAGEMLAGRPVYLTLGCTNLALGRDLIERLASPRLALELTDDVRGLEIAGIGKNIVALGAGIIDGLGLGENFRAAFIARGVVELRHLADHLGGRAATIVTVGALSDFFLSCTSPRSRNYTAGIGLATGEAGSANLAEGLNSAKAFVEMLARHALVSPYFASISEALGDPPRIAKALATAAT